MTSFDLTAGLDRKILVLIPAYNEEASLGAVIDEVRQSLPACDIVVINDGSKDKTAEIARQKDVFLLDHDINLGIGATVQTGIKFAREKGYQIAVQLDGDGQHDPNDLPRLIAPLIRDESDMAIGSRFLGPSVFVSSLPRRIGIFYFSCLNFLLTGKWITDPTSGFRAMNRRVIEFFANHYPNDYPEPEVLVTLYKTGFRLLEVPVTMQARRGGISSISFSRAFYYMFKVTFSMVAEMFRGREALCPSA